MLLQMIRVWDIANWRLHFELEESSAVLRVVAGARMARLRQLWRQWHCLNSSLRFHHDVQLWCI